MKKLTVESSNPTTNNSFCNKLVAKNQIIVPTAFGNNVSNTQETYYLFTDKQNAKGFEAELNLDSFDIVEKPYAITKEDGTMETVNLKYLYPKR